MAWLLPNEANRRRWICRQVQALPAGARLLDAGAGQQPYREACSHLEYRSQDFSQYTPGGEGLQIKDWKYAPADYLGNIWEIPEKDGAFDAILCSEVLEHIPFPNETLREFARLLKPGGVLLLTAPYASLPHMRPYFYYSGFSTDYYAETLARNQFEIQECSANGNFLLYLVQENLRSIRLVRNPLLKSLYAGLLALPVLVMRLLAAWIKDEQLVFGYHIRAVRR